MDSTQLQQKWPVVAVDNINRMSYHYVNVLGFTRVDQSETDGRVWEVLLALDDFCLILREQLVKKAEETEQKEFLASNTKQTVLFVPVVDPAAYGFELIRRGGRPLTGLRFGPDFWDHDREGFYYRDPEGQVLGFGDCGGPYCAECWEWEDRVVSVPEKREDYEKSFHLPSRRDK